MYRPTQIETWRKMVLQLPALRDRAEPSQLQVDPARVTDMDILGLLLGESIYSKEQMEEFVQFKDSQNTRRVYLAETS
jgi:hypothetical protein